MTGHATAHGSAPIRNSMIVVMKARVVREEYSIHHASFQEPRVMAKYCWRVATGSTFVASPWEL